MPRWIGSPEFAIRGRASAFSARSASEDPDVRFELGHHVFADLALDPAVFAAPTTRIPRQSDEHADDDDDELLKQLGKSVLGIRNDPPGLSLHWVPSLPLNRN